MTNPIPQVDPADVRRRLDAGEPIVLLDCREHDEVATAAIDDALHIPMGDVPANLQQLNPEATTIVFCHHGMRSLSVAQFLIQQDFDDVASLRGGIDAWSEQIDPNIPRY